MELILLKKNKFVFKILIEYNCGKESTDALAKKIDGKSSSMQGTGQT